MSFDQAFDNSTDMKKGGEAHGMTAVAPVLSVDPNNISSPASSAHRAEAQPSAAEEGQLKVRFSGLNMAAMCFLLMSTYQGWSGTVVTALYSGGPIALLWGFVIVMVCTSACAASMAEMVSIWPVADGQIAWTEHLAPPRSARFLRYYVGWLAAAGYIFMGASGAFIDGLIYTGLASINDPTYVAQRWQTCLIVWAVLAFALLVNVYGMRFLVAINYISVGIALVTLVVLTVVIWVCSPERNSASYVFTGFVNATGWENKGIVFILGMITPAFSMIGYDSVSHMCEEMYRPAVEAPRAILGSIFVSAVTTVPFILTVLFNISDIDGLASTPTGFPYLAYMYQVTPSKAAAMVLTIFTFLCTPFAVVCIVAAASRVLMSFGREGGLPYSSWFAKVDPKTQVPLNALYFTVTVEALLTLIYIGNTALFNSLLTLTIACMNLSYCIPILLMLFYARPRGLPEAPFSLGPRLGVVCNVLGASYNFFISFFLFFPNYVPVSGLNMNYASAIFGLVNVILLGYWFAGGQKTVHRLAAESK